MSELYDTLKEVTDQMHNEGNGEYTIPAWFARSLYDILENNERENKTCTYRIERRTNNESGHIWLEVLSDCGESFEFENDAYRYFNYCPYCGGSMKEKELNQ